jgi:hypothetical protein
MEHPVRTAFCKILFWKMGGAFGPTGLPIIQPGVRGKCNRAFDCGSCSHMHDWLSLLLQQGWTWGWECDKCLRETKDSDDAQNIERSVQGFYQAGRKGDLTEDDPEYDPDRPGLEGCTRCGWESSFLQLVLRRQR